MEGIEEKIISSSYELQKFIFTLTCDNQVKNEILTKSLERALRLQPKKSDALLEELYSIACDEVTNYYKAHQSEGIKEEFQPKAAKIKESDILDALEQMSSAEIIQCLNVLSQDSARVFRAHYLYQLSLEQMAHIWNVKHETVSFYLDAAMQTLTGTIVKFQGEEQ